MKIDSDFKELLLFSERLRYDTGFEDAVMSATREVAKAFHKCVTTNTPVVTGNLRKSWSNGDNLRFEVERTKGGFQVTFINQAQTSSGYHYSYYVNYGHSTKNDGWVQGRFFVEKAMAEIESLIQPIIMEELQKWWVDI